MRLNIELLKAEYVSVHERRRSGDQVMDRVDPSIFKYDYLALSTLSRDVLALISQVQVQPGSLALDVGSDKSPYRDYLDSRGFKIESLDLTPDTGPDHVGTAEETGLPPESFDLVLCTQVLEHCDNPWHAVREMHRILKPGGHLLFSVPHVWFYHPQPNDNWRFTQEGVVRLCSEAGFQPKALLSQGGSLLAAAQVFNFLAYGVMGRWGAPMYAVLNLVARSADGHIRNALFCLNFACLAVKLDAGAL